MSNNGYNRFNKSAKMTQTNQKKNFFDKLCKIIWLLMLVTVVLSVMHGAMLYKYCQMHPQKEYTIDRYNPELPEEALNKITLMNTLRLTLGMGVLLIIVYFYCEYKASPEESWITSLKKIKLEEN